MPDWIVGSDLRGGLPIIVDYFVSGQGAGACLFSTVGVSA